MPNSTPALSSMTQKLEGQGPTHHNIKPTKQNERISKEALAALCLLGIFLLAGLYATLVVTGVLAAAAVGVKITIMAVSILLISSLALKIVQLNPPLHANSTSKETQPRQSRREMHPSFESPGVRLGSSFQSSGPGGVPNYHPMWWPISLDIPSWSNTLSEDASLAEKVINGESIALPESEDPREQVLNKYRLLRIELFVEYINMKAAFEEKWTNLTASEIKRRYHAGLSQLSTNYESELSELTLQTGKATSGENA